MKSERFLLVNIVFSVFTGLFVVGTSSGGDARKTLCIERERQALLEFKQGLIDNSGILSSWGREDEKKECCSWKGVKCSNITGHVVLLDIQTTPHTIYSYNDSNLRGSITPSLLELQHLKYLDLSYNDFGGSRIPGFIGSFPRLEYLNLESANLSGEIPYSLGNLTHLQILDLSLNYGLVVKNLEWLPRLAFLRDLDLDGVHIETVNWLQQISKSPSLEKLNLGGCYLPDPIISTSHLSSNFSSRLLSRLNLRFNMLSSSTFRWLFNLSTRFTSIDLSSNRLTGLIPEAFGYNMKHLEVINLAGNILEGGLPKSFGNLSHLKALHLSLNNLNQPLPELVLSLSGKVEKSLEELYLDYNQLIGSLPDVTKFSSLKSLDLSINQLNGSFQESYGQTFNIEFLDLSFNQITGYLPNFAKFSALRVLLLNNNQFKGTLPKSIGQLSKLEILNVNSNFLEGPITESHLSNLSNLKEFDLSYNSFSFQLGPNWLPPFELDVIRLSNCEMGHHFPQWLRYQKSYSDLDISFAGISDAAPDWFWDLSPKLGYFNISNNQISGEVPDLSSKFVASKDSGFPRMDFSSNNFSGLVPSFPSNLTSLHLSKNKFVGSISFLCKIANPWFSSIDISDNLLSGELPNCWMGFEELVILNLANNNLYGKIPSSIGYLFSIKSLQLRNNNFTGALPTFLKNCRELKILDVGENKLSGEIPSWIGSHLTNLVVLSLRVNRFNGSIPPNLCHLNQVHILDLSQNSLSGQIPRCLNNITSLLQSNSSNPSIIFYFEAYDGSYYPGGVYTGDALIQWKSNEFVYNKTLGLLKIIDFSSNELAGRVPEEIVQLDELLSLNLSRNNLTGNIIEGIGKMEKLESLDLSKNQLTGRIPTSLAQLHFLSVLDLSSNNLSGEIPSSTQLQSFDPSSYAGNNELCGPPLAKCPVADHSRINNLDEDDNILSFGFYASVWSGFILGFWGVIFTLILKQSCRDAYFQLLTNVTNWIFVSAILSLRRLKMLWS